MRPSTCTLAVLALLAVPSLILAAPSDPARDLKVGNVATRLRAVDTIRRKGGPDAESLLLTALGDADWEVAGRAAEALADHGTRKSMKPLAALATRGQVRRIRLAAARSLAKLDPDDGAKRLGKALRRDEGAHAAEGLGILARASEGAEVPQLRKAVQKAVKAKEGSVRAAATGALRAFPPEERPERLARFLADEDLRVVGAALDHARQDPDATYLPAVLALLDEPSINDVIARRVIAAVEALLPLVEPGEATTSTVARLDALLQEAKAPRTAAWLARLLGRLAAPRPQPDAGEEVDVEAPPPPPLPPETALRLLEHALGHAGEAARAEAVRTLGLIGTEEAVERAIGFLEDEHARVRFQALDVLAQHRDLQDAATLDLITARLADDDSPDVRERAAFHLGRSLPEGKPFDAPVASLVKALDDESWAVATVAAVSLGKTRSPTAVGPLAARLARKTTKDWRLRGAAVVGLGTLRLKEAIPHVIGALEDKDPFVARNAYEFLLRLTKSFMPPDHDEWVAWWEYVGSKYEFEDRAALAREMKKGGYAVDPVDVYDKIGSASMDIVVLQSRGDHIEDLLAELEIPTRITRAASVPSAELHSFAIFVSNCTGEVQKGDVERLQWFVRVGGYMFCSCWALHHTVVPVYPGLVRKFQTKAEVLDNVRAEASPFDSPFLEGVFPSWTRPIYVLFGSHLIEVLQPERVEVLIDSPDCASRWGNGNLACWFPLGHGVILDSANHFDLQGLERARGLKTPGDRMGYAMDHMGMDFPQLRKLAAEGVWAKHSEAVKKARDLSAFRFITNFVRMKRRTEP